MSNSNVIPFPNPVRRANPARARGPQLVNPALRELRSQALPANLLWMPPAPRPRSLWPARAIEALRRECGQAGRIYAAAISRRSSKPATA